MLNRLLSFLFLKVLSKSKGKGLNNPFQNLNRNLFPHNKHLLSIVQIVQHINHNLQIALFPNKGGRGAYAS